MSRWVYSPSSLPSLPLPFPNLPPTLQRCPLFYTKTSNSSLPKPNTGKIGEPRKTILLPDAHFTFERSRLSRDRIFWLKDQVVFWRLCFEAFFLSMGFDLSTALATSPTGPNSFHSTHNTPTATAATVPDSTQAARLRFSVGTCSVTVRVPLSPLFALPIACAGAGEKWWNTVLSPNKPS